MRFTVLPARATVPDGSDVAFLEPKSWDDFGYKTTFELYYRDADGTIHYLGAVKIGTFSLAQARQPDVPEEFGRLNQSFFSLGQDDSYYSQLNSLGDGVRDEILQALNDAAVNPELFARSPSR